MQDVTANGGFISNVFSNNVVVDDIATTNRLIPLGETPGSISLADFLSDISYTGFFDSAVVAGQNISPSLGLFRFDLGSTLTSVNEIFVSRTTDAVIITEDPANPGITNDPSLLTVFSGTVASNNVITDTLTNFFLDVDTIAASTSVPEPNPFVLILVLLITGLLGLAKRRKAA